MLATAVIVSFASLGASLYCIKHLQDAYRDILILESHLADLEDEILKWEERHGDV